MDPGFPRGGRQLIIRPNFLEYFMKMKKIGPRRGPTSQICFCKSATAKWHFICSVSYEWVIAILHNNLIEKLLIERFSNKIYSKRINTQAKELCFSLATSLCDPLHIMIMLFSWRYIIISTFFGWFGFHSINNYLRPLSLPFSRLT